MTLLGIPSVPQDRTATVTKIKNRLSERRQTLPEAIRERELYFRVSVVGTCNLSCQFCHNEGAPTAGKLSLKAMELAVRAAAETGFTRIQITGGEPLLRPDVADFVRIAKKYVDNIGVTTNGTYLPIRLSSIVDAGVVRLHVSLQSEPLREAGEHGEWGIPNWLLSTVDRATQKEFALRLNLPVPADCLPKAKRFLTLLTSMGISVKVFSVLPEGNVRNDRYPLSELEAMVEDINVLRASSHGTVLIRRFRPPQGLRCANCAERSNCKEQSHSLRLGADLRLRPCLASRQWDSHFDADNPDESVSEAALLSLDYVW